MPADDDGSSAGGSALGPLIQLFGDIAGMLRNEPILLVGIALTIALVALGVLGHGDTQPIAFSIAGAGIVAMVTWSWGRRRAPENRERLEAPENRERLAPGATVESSPQKIRLATSEGKVRNDRRVGRGARVTGSSQEIVIGPGNDKQQPGS